jgi:hypothetical protein
MYGIQIVWNREFHWVDFGRTADSLSIAKDQARSYLNMGDGASVKKAQVINVETGDVVIQSYEL